MSKILNNARRPSEAEMEASILKEEMRRKGQHASQAVLDGAARARLRMRDERVQRQEFFNRKRGWGNNPFAGLKIKD